MSGLATCCLLFSGGPRDGGGGLAPLRGRVLLHLRSCVAGQGTAAPLRAVTPLPCRTDHHCTIPVRAAGTLSAIFFTAGLDAWYAGRGLTAMPTDRRGRSLGRAKQLGRSNRFWANAGKDVSSGETRRGPLCRSNTRMLRLVCRQQALNGWHQVLQVEGHLCGIRCWGHFALRRGTARSLRNMPGRLCLRASAFDGSASACPLRNPSATGFGVCACETPISRRACLPTAPNPDCLRAATAFTPAAPIFHFVLKRAFGLLATIMLLRPLLRLGWLHAAALLRLVGQAMHVFRFRIFFGCGRWRRTPRRSASGDSGFFSGVGG
mmetsp:Transcript_69592/g.185261  ORF Transcript_69592/g.185261 Transcript_69592/m.185261 type:complete len:321 (-) Transcript_69592:860-1822(-)